MIQICLPMQICTQWIPHESIHNGFFPIVCNNMQDNVALWGSCKANAIQSIWGFLHGEECDQENKCSILLPASVHLTYLAEDAMCIIIMHNFHSQCLRHIQQLAGILHTHTIALYMTQSVQSASEDSILMLNLCQQSFYYSMCRSKERLLSQC